MAGLSTFTGSCHCGATGYSFETAIAVARWTIRACQCGFCRAHGAQTTSDPAGQLTFLVHRPESLRRYRFGLKTADFLLCSSCGVYMGAQIETPQGGFGTVNVLALGTLAQGLPAAVPADYSSEGPGERSRRRAERWTPLVKVV
jgi:hypothetical protein